MANSITNLYIIAKMYSNINIKDTKYYALHLDEILPILINENLSIQEQYLIIKENICNLLMIFIDINITQDIKDNILNYIFSSNLQTCLYKRKLNITKSDMEDFLLIYRILFSLITNLEITNND